MKPVGVPTERTYEERLADHNLQARLTPALLGHGLTFKQRHEILIALTPLVLAEQNRPRRIPLLGISMKDFIGIDLPDPPPETIDVKRAARRVEGADVLWCVLGGWMLGVLTLAVVVGHIK